jgi:hypothetical protein
MFKKYIIIGLFICITPIAYAHHCENENLRDCYFGSSGPGKPHKCMPEGTCDVKSPGGNQNNQKPLPKNGLWKSFLNAFIKEPLNPKQRPQVAIPNPQSINKEFPCFPSEDTTDTTTGGDTGGKICDPFFTRGEDRISCRSLLSPWEQNNKAYDQCFENWEKKYGYKNC